MGWFSPSTSRTSSFLQEARVSGAPGGGWTGVPSGVEVAELQPPRGDREPGGRGDLLAVLLDGDADVLACVFGERVG